MKSLAKILMLACLAFSVSMASANASGVQINANVDDVDSRYDVFEFSPNSQLAELSVTVSIPKDCNNHQIDVLYYSEMDAYVVVDNSTVMGCHRRPSKTKFTRFNFTLQPFRDGSLRLKVPKGMRISMIPICFPFAPAK